MNTQDFKKQVTNQIIDLMKDNGKDWIKSWAGGNAGFPKNAVTKNYYQGINPILLMMSGASSDKWATYKQWTEQGRQVRKGSKATHIIFYKTLVKENEEGGEDKKIPMLKTYAVFNEEQLEDYQQPEENGRAFEDFKNVEQFVWNTGATIEFKDNSAYYMPSMDYINMPNKKSFLDVDGATAEQNYYATLLHELTHWTKHETRCNRKQSTNKTEYAFEELVAEIGSTFLSVHLGVEKKPLENHAKYLNNWLEALENDNNLIFKASAQSGRAFDYLIKCQEQLKKVA